MAVSLETIARAPRYGFVQLFHLSASGDDLVLHLQAGMNDVEVDPAYMPDSYLQPTFQRIGGNATVRKTFHPVPDISDNTMWEAITATEGAYVVAEPVTAIWIAATASTRIALVTNGEVEWEDAS